MAVARGGGEDDGVVAEVAGRFALQVDTMETRAVVARAAGAKLEAAMVMG